VSFLDDVEVEPRPLRRPLDPVSIAAGSDHFAVHYRFDDLLLPVRLGDTQRLTVSRYYWDVVPPLAVDFRREVRYGVREVEAKREFFSSRRVRYVLVHDKWAGEEVEYQIQSLVMAEAPEPDIEDWGEWYEKQLQERESDVASTHVKPLLTSPRRK